MALVIAGKPVVLSKPIDDIRAKATVFARVLAFIA